MMLESCKLKKKKKRFQCGKNLLSENTFISEAELSCFIWFLDKFIRQKYWFFFSGQKVQKFIRFILKNDFMNNINV